MPAREHEFIIVGQGLSGSILAYTLIQQGQSVLVIDNNLQGSASSVAAGIINPITGHRLNITDRFEDYYPLAKNWYQTLEKDLGRPFWQPIEQTRLIKNHGQKQYLKQRKMESAYDKLLGPGTHIARTGEAFKPNEFGAVQVRQSATVDAPALLEALKRWLIGKESYRCGRLDYKTIVTNDDFFRIGEDKAKRLIFCEGYQAIHNPWLQHLPFKLAKGEILTIKTEPIINNSLLSWGNWLVSSNKQSKLGSNFIWNDLSLTPNKASGEKLLASLHDNTNITAKVVEHNVGIRPTTTQRKPFIGEITHLKRAYCFNGFGSKGCLLIPYYAQLLSQHLLKNTSLPEELTQWI